ncbi:TNFRSF6B [Mytilus coruscus]|uniref:TNFRSF6B n=1 Tax=Mytilus coruscus TaxID=42192 RepID=A0A6J8D261_MYTCO|nr:TNFRSF6B [Mytilus coruscus]
MINCLPHAEISHTILTKAYIKVILHLERKGLLQGQILVLILPTLLSNGLTCYVCRPGFYKRSDCTVNKTTASCEPCPKGEYNGNYNIAVRCESCRTYCVDQNAIVENQCNSTVDITCRCKDGFYNHSKGSGEWICVPFSDCPPGEELYLGEQSQSWKIYVPIIIVVFIIGIVLVLLLLYRYGYLSTLKEMCCRFNEKVQTEMNDVTIESQCNNNNNNQQIDEIRSNLPSSRDAYINDEACSSTETDRMWSPVFRRISTVINLGEWKSVMRTLFSKYDEIQAAERKIEEICHDYPNDVKEQIYQSLLKWLKRAGDNAFLDDISSALEKDNMLSLADELENEYPMLLLKKCNEKNCLQVRKLSSSC